MPPKAKPKFPFLLLEPSMILARTSVKCWRTSFGGSEDMGNVSAHPTRGREFLAVERKHYLLKKFKFSRIIYLSPNKFPKNLLLQYKLTGSEAERAHATMGQNCSLGARALTLGDLSLAVGFVALEVLAALAVFTNS
jgi:hypothetical protein